MGSKPNNSDAAFNGKVLSIVMCLFGTITPAVAMPASLPTAASRLGISTANMTALWALFNDWVEFYSKSLMPIFKGHAIINDKNDTRIAWELLWSSIVNDMIKSALTNEDRVALFLPKRDAERTEVQPKEDAPQVVFEPNVHGVHNIRFINPDDPDTKALPEGQNIFLETFVGSPNLADDAIPFNKADVITHFLHELRYDESEIGKTAYLRPYYITKTGKKGVPGLITRRVIS